jgi:DNA primase catalytic subunit
MEEQKKEEKEAPSLKEERVRKICFIYYSRPDIRKAIFDFSKNRECVPRYFEGFGKRPDSFQFDSDILELAKNGATSFHCSEELWKDPLQLSTELGEEELRDFRQGWDLLIDIDCKYIEYSKKAANAIILALKQNRVNNIGIKFSGGKGFHIIVPWKAFPDEMSGRKTKEMFPEWPRMICEYLKEQSREFLEKDMYSSENQAILSKLKKGVRCERCKNMAEKSELVLFSCQSCRTKMENLTSSFENKRKIRCPNCQTEMKELDRYSFYLCRNCNINSRKNPDNFNEAFEHIDVFEILGLDVILVSPRHLFRMPYSLHEKTALASIVLNPEKILDFDMIRDADPFKAKPQNFLPNSEPGEASLLLRNAVEFCQKNKEKLESSQKSDVREIETIENKNKEKENFGGKKFNEITITNLTPEMYPPSIKTILEGMKADGRKRALFILLNFFTSLKLEPEKIKEIIEEWNKKNYNPLKEGYIRSQISWYSKQKSAKLPPNFDKSYYKDIGIIPSEEELRSKNPVSYVIRKSFQHKTSWKNKK